MLWALSLADEIKDPRNVVNVSPGSSPWVEVNGANHLAMAISVWPYFNCDFRVRVIHSCSHCGTDG